MSFVGILLIVFRLILALGSSVFRAMFYGDLVEKGVVSVPDLEPQAFRILLK